MQLLLMDKVHHGDRQNKDNYKDKLMKYVITILTKYNN